MLYRKKMSVYSNPIYSDSATADLTILNALSVPQTTKGAKYLADLKASAKFAVDRAAKDAGVAEQAARDAKAKSVEVSSSRGDYGAENSASRHGENCEFQRRTSFL